MSTITTKYGTKIDVTGLTPAQIATVKSTAEANGAYGAKGAALAKTLQQKNATPQNQDNTGNSSQSGGQASGDTTTGLTPHEQARLDYLLKHRPNDPQVKQLQSKLAVNAPGGSNDPGNKGAGTSYQDANNYLDSLIKNLKPLDLSGAPKLLTSDDINADRSSVYNSIYQNDIQGNAEQKARDMEAEKQDLANRGIPLDFKSDPNNPNNLYAQSIGDIDTRYDKLDQTARNSANAQADASVNNLIQGNATLNDTFVGNATKQFQSQLDTLSTTGSVLTDLMQKYNIDADTAKSILAAKTSTSIARIQSQRTGSGSGSSGGSGSGTNGATAGGDATGFNT